MNKEKGGIENREWGSGGRDFLVDGKPSNLLSFSDRLKD